MGKLGFYFNQDNCVGCRACQMACKDRNDLEVGYFFRHVTSFETGAYPRVGLYHYAATCNHCASPACVVVCPQGAMYIDVGDGTVQHDDTLCIGCQQCAKACPYGVPVYIESQEIVRKCDSCKPLRDAGGNPVCVDACNMRVLEFGDLDELAAAHPGEDLVCDLPVLPDSSATTPSLLVNPRAFALEEDYRDVMV